MFVSARPFFEEEPLWESGLRLVESENLFFASLMSLYFFFEVEDFRKST